MELRAEIVRLAGWGGWRRYGPAGGSVAAHLLAGSFLAVVLAASGRAERLGLERGFGVELTLLPDASPASPAPVRMSAPPPSAEPDPAPDAEPVQRTSDEISTAVGVAGGGDPSSADVSEYRGAVTSAPAGTALGLRSLLETDPCHPQGGSRTHGDCSWDWVTLTERGDPAASPSLKRLAELYPGYRLPNRQAAAQPTPPAAHVEDE